MQPETISTRKILKTTAWQIWYNIAYIIKEKNISLTLKKIKAHSNNIFNEKADHLAKEATTYKHDPIITIVL